MARSGLRSIATARKEIEELDRNRVQNSEAQPLSLIDGSSLASMVRVKEPRLEALSGWCCVYSGCRDLGCAASGSKAVFSSSLPTSSSLLSAPRASLRHHQHAEVIGGDFSHLLHDLEFTACAEQARPPVSVREVSVVPPAQRSWARMSISDSRRAYRTVGVRFVSRTMCKNDQHPRGFQLSPLEASKCNGVQRNFGVGGGMPLTGHVATVVCLGKPI